MVLRTLELMSAANRTSSNKIREEAKAKATALGHAEPKAQPACFRPQPSQDIRVKEKASQAASASAAPQPFGLLRLCEPRWSVRFLLLNLASVSLLECQILQVLVVLVGQGLGRQVHGNTVGA